ncbi:hypothetical protein UlMin_002138 [Ulmus minor]
MNSEELSSLCASLALEEDEDTLAPDLEAGLRAQGERSIDRSLVGCVLSTGPVARDAFVHMIKEVVISGGPWCFQNKLLVLEEPTGVGDYSKMSFSNTPFWIQLHNIPVFCMSETVGSILGNMVGTVQEVECNQDGLCLGTFIRVRAIIDISKPLKRILKVRLGPDKELVTILIRYEHLPELCFHCGVIGHPLKECPKRGSFQGDNLKLKYGAWIRAPNPQHSETSVQSKRRRSSPGPSPLARVHRSTTRLHHHSVNGVSSQTAHPKQRTTAQPTGLHPTSSRPACSHQNSGHNGSWVRKTKTANSSSQSPNGLQSHPLIALDNVASHVMESSSYGSTLVQDMHMGGTPDTMNILVWNVQGLGNDWTFRILHVYVQQYSPSLIFLLETLCSKAQMERLRVRLGYTGMLTWEREGRSSGLCLLWSDSIHVQLLSGSRGHIDVQVTSHDSTCWHFTGLYGNPDTSLRTQFWTLLKRLRDASSMPWLCGGDLNEILFGHEKQGGATRAQYLMNAFREAANYCGLADLGFRGPKFTWNRGKNACLVQERLDRMLGNSGWLDLFSNSLVHHLNLRGSDHRPLLIWKRGRFHFEENSKFFHQKASARKAKNSISGLLDENGEWCENEEGLALIIESYFKSLFTSSSPYATNYDRVLDTIEPKITPQLNRQLERDFEAEDVRIAVFQMAPTKSPGADGMSAIFYQKIWPTVGEEITSACLGFVNGRHPLGSINETIITLLPKIKNPTRITEFRPISLCNVLYKIISKMLANRLRKIMDSVISQEQSAFIPGRLISDNAIIGFECLHAIKRQKTKKNFLALKLDMAKAYDRVEWGFIYKIMNKLGFSEVWTNKIMACISSVSYSFQFNGQRVGHLIPSRGLRQGDPLSPYLFLFCGERLSSLLHHYEQSGLI